MKAKSLTRINSRKLSMRTSVQPMNQLLVNSHVEKGQSASPSQKYHYSLIPQPSFLFGGSPFSSCTAGKVIGLKCGRKLRMLQRMWENLVQQSERSLSFGGSSVNGVCRSDSGFALSVILLVKPRRYFSRRMLSI